MPHAALTPAAPTDRAALAPPPATAAKRRGTPWRAAIAEARAARIAAWSTRRAARAPAADGQTRATHANASTNPPVPPRVPIVPYTGDGLLERELTARAAGLRAPAIRPSQRAPKHGPAAPFKPFRIDPLNRERTAKPGATAPFKPFRLDPLNREPGAFPDPDPQPAHRFHETAQIRESTRCAANAVPAPQARKFLPRINADER